MKSKKINSRSIHPDAEEAMRQAEKDAEEFKKQTGNSMDHSKYWQRIKSHLDDIKREKRLKNNVSREKTTTRKRLRAGLRPR